MDETYDKDINIVDNTAEIFLKIAASTNVYNFTYDIFKIGDNDSNYLTLFMESSSQQYYIEIFDEILEISTSNDINGHDTLYIMIKPPYAITQFIIIFIIDVGKDWRLAENLRILFGQWLGLTLLPNSQIGMF